MPQEFQVLKCYSCKVFQVHQTKKAKKWACKVCGEKQSLFRAFMIGSSSDCRKFVQKLNFEAGEKKLSNDYEESEDYDSLKTIQNDFFESTKDSSLETQGSKNNDYLNTMEELSYNPRKKQRRDMQSQYEEISKDESTSSNSSSNECVSCDKNQVEVLEQVQSMSSKSLLEIDFDLLDDNSTQRTDPITVDNPKTNILPAFKYSRKLPTPKNRGFQLILKAAQKKATSALEMV